VIAHLLATSFSYIQISKGNSPGIVSTWRSTFSMTEMLTLSSFSNLAASASRVIKPSRIFWLKKSLYSFSLIVAAYIFLRT
jgi:hypothetical protein